jgi:hypothetical protein
MRLHPTVPPRGRAVLSFSTHLYARLHRGDAPTFSHPSAWTNYVLARSLLDRGMLVDVIDWDDPNSEPEAGADIVVDVAQNLERLAVDAGRNAVKILYAMFAHARHLNALNAARHEALRLRRGFCLSPTRRVRETRSAENATDLIFPGGKFSLASFSGSPASIHPIPQVRPFERTILTNAHSASTQGNFLWMAGPGAVHKGLDLTLDAFAQMPGFSLHVLMDLDTEPEFKTAYRRELMESPNIHYHGFVDTNSSEWLDIAGKCSAFLTTSCCEVRNTAALACMRSGRIPILTAGADIDAPRSGISITDHSIAAIKNAVQAFAGLGLAELEQRGQAAREEAEVLCGRSRVVSTMAEIMSRLIGPIQVASDIPDLNHITGISRIEQLST